MRILILGAGALGSLIGARLSRTNGQVLLLTTDREHVASIQQRGLLVEELDGSTSRYYLPAHDHPHTISEKPDIVIVTVKSYDTVAAVHSVMDCCCASTVFLTLQNGIGNWESISQMVGEESVLAGSTAQGATMLEPGMIRHGGNGQTHVGEINGRLSPRVHRIVDVFRQAEMEAHASDAMQRLIWEKLLINVGINAITALTGITNGLVAELEPARHLSQSAVQEAFDVARARGFAIDVDIFERVLAVAKATATNRSSMLQDVDRKKRTEIDAINGAVVRFGQEAGIATPVNQSLARLVHTLEATYLIKEAN